MKLNNVVIMHLADIRRSFSFREFWEKKDEYFTLVENKGRLTGNSKYAGLPLFFYNKEQEYAHKVIKKWADGQKLSDIDRAMFLSKDVIRELGFGQKFSEAEKIGLSAICDLFGVKIDKEFLATANSVLHSDVASSDGIIRLKSNATYSPMTQHSAADEEYSCRTIVNVSNKTISITLGLQVVELSSGCALPVIVNRQGSICHLLCSSAANNNGVQCHLYFKNNRVELLISEYRGQVKVPDVQSFFLSDSGCAWFSGGMLKTGTLEEDFGFRMRLKDAQSLIAQKWPGAQIIAIDKYSIYTTKHTILL